MVNRKLNPAFASICTLLMLMVLHDAKASLQTTFIEDLCYNQKSVILDLRYQPTGILMSLPQTESTQPFECEVILSAPRESSIVVSIFRFDVSPDDLLTIEDSDRFKITLTGYGNFRDEKKAIISEGRTAINYRRNISASSHSRQGFQFTFTAAKKNGPCYGNEYECKNRLCILKQYVCDGHNHCGDGSDQKTCVPKNEAISNSNLDGYQERYSSKISIIWIAIIGVAGITVFIIVIVFIVVVVRRANSRKQKTPPAENSSNQNSGGNVPLHSVSSTVPQQQPPAPTTGGLPSAPPAFEQDGYSFYNRIRRSLRGQKTPKTEEVSRETAPSEVYQVPSMYPNLDHHEPESLREGIENPEFKIEE